MRSWPKGLLSSKLPRAGSSWPTRARISFCHGNNRLQFLDGNQLAAALTSGIHRVVRRQVHLNAINVFPVADNDTGTNLSLSLSSLLALLNTPRDSHVGTLLTAVADTLLDHARGNSGAIVAQFFQGMSDSADELAHFTTQTFCDAVGLGSEYAHDALSQPMDGTMLSAIAAYAASIQQQAVTSPPADFAEMLTTARYRVAEAVKKTTDQLDALRKANVVDAGALGFSELINGLSDFLIEGEMTPHPDAALSALVEEPIRISVTHKIPGYRYCTECIVTGDDIDRRKLREALAECGDSLVLAGSKRKAKIHIHVDAPDTVFNIARRYGELSGEKADDMQRQQFATHDQVRKFAVVTDSAADIDDADMERLDIHMVPCRIHFGTRSYLDKVSITSEEFFDELASNPHHPTTSQPAPGDFRRQFQFLASHFRDVLSINLTSQGSGTYDGARAAAARSKAAGNIHVVDSRNASTGLGQLVVFAAECAQAGLDVERTMAAIRTQIPQTKSFALLNDLNYATRGGRLPRWIKTIAAPFKLSPVLATKRSGNVGLSGFLFGRRNHVARFARFVANKIDSRATLEIGIGHAICAEDAKHLAQELTKILPSIRKLTINVLGSGLGVHGGPGTLIVSVRPWLSVQDIAAGIE